MKYKDTERECSKKIGNAIKKTERESWPNQLKKTRKLAGL